MTRHASGGAGVVVLALFFLLLGETRYLAPFRRGFLAGQGLQLAAFFVGLYLNLLAGLVVVSRRLWLQGAGQKLQQVDQEIRAGRHGLSREITDDMDDDHAA